MTKELVHIDALIAQGRHIGLEFDFLRVIFETGLKDNLAKLEKILTEDEIRFTKSRYFFKWRLIAEFPIIESYSESEYQRLIGKLFMLSSRLCINLGTVCLVG